MDQTDAHHTESMPPREAKLLENYFLGLPLYLCAKIAKYRAKSKSALANTTKRIVKKYVSQAGKDQISTRAGGHVGNWWREVNWLKKRCRAKGDLKTLATALKMQGEAIGALKARDFEADTGALIIIGDTQPKVQKQPKKPKKAAGDPGGKVVNLPVEMEGD